MTSINNKVNCSLLDIGNSKALREHNDANILSIPARFVTETLALEMVDIFIFTEFEAS